MSLLTNVKHKAKIANRKNRGKGKVYLVGAGPGSPDLLTLRAVACLKKADVILHDRLIPTEVIKTYAPQAKLVYVGKKASFHTLAQDDIEKILIREAARGKVVVRLKGGDPYILGRGGEEAERLFDAGIAFEVVPGISSAFAVPLFAGIPLTHRKFTPELAIVTGHENPRKTGELPYHAGVEREASSWIHWPTLARMGTIVFLMGMGNLRANMVKLVEHGLDPETPAAVIRWGGLGKQKSVMAKVGTIADTARRAGIKAPAVIVVGKVVGLAGKLNWFERRKFYGKTFLITRDPEGNTLLRQALNEESAHVVEWPSYVYAPVKPDPQTSLAMRHINRSDWLIFTSVRAVTFFLTAFDKIQKDRRILATVKIAAVGTTTAAKLREEKLWVDLIPRDASAASLAAEEIFNRSRELRIFIPGAADAREEFATTHGKRHKVFTAVLYRKKRIAHSSEAQAELLSKKIDWTLFYSPSAVDAFLRGFSSEEGAARLKSCHLAAIGKTTADHLKSLGFKCSLVAHETSTEALLAAINV